MIRFLVLCTVLFVVFRQWFLPGFITARDFPGITKIAIEQVSFFPFLWSSVFGDSLGGPTISYIWSHFPHVFPMFLFGKLMQIPPDTVLRIGYLYPFLIFGSVCTYIFAKKYVPPSWAWIGSLVITVNTYSLLIIGGGQMGVALAYSIAPLVLASFIQLFETPSSKRYNFKLSIIAGLVLALQAMFDARIAYVTMIAIGLYFIINLLTSLRVNGFKQIIFKVLFGFIISVLIAALLHFFWLLPLFLIGQNPIAQLGPAYNSSAAVKFLSFADFSHTLSFLHPNWPENIFGKIYFLQPEFILLPILTYSSLLFIRNSKLNLPTGGQNSKLEFKIQKFKNNLAIEQSNNKTIIFFALLGLVGTFLAKGANPPFGEIYIWLFKHFPGFMMFRDPTKWYTLIAISYSVLVPLSVWRIYAWLNSKLNPPTGGQNSKEQLKIQKYIPNLFLILTCFYLLFLIRPAVLGQLSGTFKTTRAPGEYVKLKDFLYNQPQFFRTLWVPVTQRFSFSSDNHPAISGQGILEVTDTPKVGMQLFKPNSEQLIQEAGVKYIIVPYDSEAEIFLKDRKYDEEQYRETVNRLKSVKWLKPLDEKFGKIVLFEVPNTRDHFFLVPQTHDLRSKINYQMINPTKYLVNLKNMKKGTTLVFSESYDVGWKAKVVNDSSVKEIATVAYGGLTMTNRLNSFVLPESQSYTLEVIYEPQKWVNVGLIVAIGTFILCILFLAHIFMKSNICCE